jgi:microsomal dipeptidase-like Zn-dependent dipeptidase
VSLTGKLTSSHVSDKTFYDTLAVSTMPVIASHSSCRALVDFPRNMSDDMLRALAINGGVVGVNSNSGFLNQISAITAALIQKGYSERDIHKIMGTTSCA